MKSICLAILLMSVSSCSMLPRWLMPQSQEAEPSPEDVWLDRGAPEDDMIDAGSDQRSAAQKISESHDKTLRLNADLNRLRTELDREKRMRMDRETALATSQANQRNSGRDLEDLQARYEALKMKALIRDIEALTIERKYMLRRLGELQRNEDAVVTRSAGRRNSSRTHQ